MTTENIIDVSVNDDNELLLKIKGEGKPMYQYIYRAAAGVHWDENNKVFKSSPIKEQNCSDWFTHIISVAQSELGVELRLNKGASWKNVPDTDKVKIIEKYAI